MWLPLLLVTIAEAAPKSSYIPAKYKEAGSLLAAAVNFSADPCSDFYSFACGGWVDKHKIASDRTSVSPFSILRDKVQVELRELFESDGPTNSTSIKQARMIYRACLNVEALETNRGSDLVRSIKAISVWPVIEPFAWTPKEFDLTSLLVDVGLRGVSPFLEVYISTDPQNTTRRLLNVDQGALGLGGGSRNYYLNQTKYAKQINAYKKYIFDKISLIADDSHVSVDPDNLHRDIDEMIELETSLAKILVAEEDRRNFTEMHNVRKLSQMSQYFPLLDWNRYLKDSSPYEVHSYFDSDPDVLITDIEYLHRLTDFLTSNDPRVVTNYILLRYSASFGMQLDSRYEDIYEAFIRTLLGRENKSERWKDCVNVASAKMSHATGSLYIRRHFNEHSKATIEGMIDEIQQSFFELLHENEWMDKRTKKEALAKANQMIRLIAYPDWILNDTALDDWYHGVYIVSTDSFGQQVEKMYRWSNDLSYRRLLEPVDRHEFHTNPSTVNAFYSSIKNGITFPAAILQPPFFCDGFPMSLNFGAIGAIIGHEITHGFDDSGNQFDGQGSLHDWWDGETRKNFETRAQCIIDQYSAQEVPETELFLNGKLTQGENIADNGGVKQAYRSYMRYLKKHGAEPHVPGFEHYSNAQMFFLGYAQNWCQKFKPQALQNLILSDPHAPGRYRTNIVLANQKEFADAYKCPLGTPMNPEKKCSVW